MLASSLHRRSRLALAAVAVVSSLLVTACKNNSKDEGNNDPLGYYLPSDYERLGIRMNSASIFNDPNRRAVADAVDANQPIAIRVLLNILKSDHALMYRGPGVRVNSNLEGDLHTNFSTLFTKMAELDSVSQDPTRLKYVMERSLAKMNGRYRFSRGAHSILSLLKRNVGNAYSGTLLLDMVLRERLQQGYPANRMVVIYEEGHMLLGEIVSQGGAFALVGYETTRPGLIRKEYGLTSNVSKRIRVVSTNDFLFAEAMRANMMNPDDVAKVSVSRFAANYNMKYYDKFSKSGYASTPLNNSIFSWGQAEYDDGEIDVEEANDQLDADYDGRTLGRGFLGRGHGRQGPPMNRFVEQEPPQVQLPPQGPPPGPQVPRVPREDVIQQEVAKTGIRSLVCAVELDSQEVPPARRTRLNEKLRAQSQLQFQFVQLAGQSTFAVSDDGQMHELVGPCRQMALSFLTGLGRQRRLVQELAAKGGSNVLLVMGGSATFADVKASIAERQVNEPYTIYLQGKDF